MSMGVYYSPYCVPTYWYALGVYISAWASALLVRLNWAMRRPQSVGRVTVRLPRFFRVYPKLDINPIRDREPLEAIFRSDGIFFTR